MPLPPTHQMVDLAATVCAFFLAIETWCAWRRRANHVCLTDNAYFRSCAWGAIVISTELGLVLLAVWS